MPQSAAEKYEAAKVQPRSRFDLAALSRKWNLGADKLAALARESGFQLERTDKAVWAVVYRGDDGHFRCVVPQCEVIGKKDRREADGAVKLKSAGAMAKHHIAELRKVAEKAFPDALGEHGLSYSTSA